MFLAWDAANASYNYRAVAILVYYYNSVDDSAGQYNEYIMYCDIYLCHDMIARNYYHDRTHVIYPVLCKLVKWCL